tara:strand:+ start:1217 stop:1627 length:411 start_codon:yes stop_codon:yes gene_type:complete
MGKSPDKILILDNSVIKKFRGDKLYNKEKHIYQLNLEYIPKLISFDDVKKELIIEKFGVDLVKIVPRKKRIKYYPKIKELYFKFFEDTGFYLWDFRPANIVINLETEEIKLIDFEYYGENRIWKSNINFLRIINVI